MADDSVLDISTEIVRSTIKIDGTTYAMRSDSELSLEEAHELSVLGRRLNNLMEKDKLDENQKALLASIASDITSKIMLGFDEVSELLSDLQKMQIVNVFMERAKILKAM